MPRAWRPPAPSLTQIIQQDLVKLGYDPGAADGEPSVATAIAISKFQAENGLEMTGEATPQLAGIIKAVPSGDAPATPAAAAAPAAPAAQATLAASWSAAAGVRPVRQVQGPDVGRPSISQS